MSMFAELVSLKRLAENHYEAVFAHDQKTYTKCFEVLKKDGHETISIDDTDLDPRLFLTGDTRRALFAFHRAFRILKPVEERSEIYEIVVQSRDKLPQAEKEAADLLMQMLELHKKGQEIVPQMSPEDTKKWQRENKKFVTDPDAHIDTDILHRPLA